MSVYIESKSNKLNIEDSIGVPNGTEGSPSLYFQTDTDTGIYYANGDFSFSVGGDKKLSINSNSVTTTVGLVLNPSLSTLPVSAENVACYLSKSLGLGVSNWNLYANGSAPNYFNGSVGIGTTTPGSKLEVNGVITVSAGTAASPAIVSGTGTSDTGVFWPAADTVAISTAGVERFRADVNGVQIRSDVSPLLTLYSTRINVLAGETLAGIEWYNSDATTNAEGVRAFVRAIENDGGFGRSFDMAFGTGDAATATERVRITKVGNVGIGTNNPGSRLEVSGVITVSAGTAASPAIVSGTGTSDTGVFWPAADTIAISTGGVERLRIGNTGFVGIGTSGSASVGLRLHHAHNANNIVGLMNNIQLNSSAVTSYSYWTNPALLAENNAYTTHIHYIANYIGSTPSGSSMGTEVGFQAGNSIQPHTVRAFVSALNTLSGYERYAIYCSGSAPSLFNGRVFFPVGSQTEPSIAITTDTNTGLYAPAADNFAIATGGSERFRIDSSGKILVGTTTSRTAGPAVHPAFQFEGTNAGSASFQCIAGSSQAAVSPQIVLARHRGVVGASNLVQDGDTLGIIRFNGGDDTDCISNAATIECRVDGTPGSNDMPGRLMFSTTSDGSAVSTERFRIKSNGVVRFIPLSADPASAEEGDMYFNSTSKKLKVYDGTSWVDLH